MANNKLYGYTPDPSKEVDGNRLDRLNPYEFKKGMDYELVNMGIARLAESTEDERQKATEKVIQNLQEYAGYYSALIEYETRYRNPSEGQTKPSFKAYLKEIEGFQMIEVDKTYSNDKMVKPKYKKEDYTTKFETGKMGNFKLKALKEAIKSEIVKEAKKNKKYNKRPLNEIEDCANLGNDCSVQVWIVHNTGGGANEKRCGTVEESNSGGCFCGSWGKCEGKVGVGGNDVLDADRTATKNIPTHGTGPTNPNYVTHRGPTQYGPDRKPIRNEIQNISKAIKEEVYNHLQEAKDDDFEDKEPTSSQIKGIDKSIGDAKDALARAMAKVKELAPDIKKLAKETNAEIKKNPAGKIDYLKTYTTNPDVKEFIKLRKMLKSADLL